MFQRSLFTFVLSGVFLATLCVPGWSHDGSENQSSDVLTAEQKLDLVLKEIQKLNQRVGALEGRLRAMTAAKPVEARTQRRVINPKQPNIRPGDVIDMRNQGDFPKNIHELERQLRRRSFPAESWPITID